MHKLLSLAAGLLLALAVLQPAVAEDGRQPTVESFVKRDLFGTIKISPTGEYLAVTVPLEDRTSLVILKRADLSRSGHVTLPKNTHVQSFYWVNPGRVLFSIGEKGGDLAQPRGTGELYGVNADGSGQGSALIGMRSGSRGRADRSSNLVFASLLDSLRNDDDFVLVSTSDTTGATQVERMHVETGRRIVVTRVPVRRAQFLTDASSEVRFATGAGNDNKTRTYYRAGSSAEWELINDEKATGIALYGVGFSADGKTAYVRAEEKQGPDGFYAFDPVTKQRELLLRHETVDPTNIFVSPLDDGVYGVGFSEGRPTVDYLAPNDVFAQRHRAMQAAVPDQAIIPLSFTSDGKLGLYYGYNDRTPGDFYLFDADANKATFLVAKNSWVDPETMSEMKPISFTARDGLEIHGFLTLPKGGEGKRHPLVVNPHGGPFGVADQWGYNPEVQLLASRGYAVLQVNFRGSGNHGRSFMRAGYQQWGGAMQDDLTDATRWAIAQGVADARRICIYGGSYGGYASLMGVAKEPDLYRCAIGNVGVYDMQAMYNSGDIPQSRSGKTFLEEALGRQDLAAISPNRLAANIKVPVFLAAGREDERAPPSHTEAMDRALKAAGVPVETVIYEGEGHGNYLPKNRIDFATRVLSFLDKHIGGGAAQ